ncbi:MAG: ribose-phosphate diphosphokinase [Gammaproteobacteria bacterium]|jgi:ribose-phosphate pyrophosphokinase
MLFGIEASRDGAQRLARELGLEVASHEEREFEDGEFKIRPLEDVARERVVLYQSLSGREGTSVNDKLLRVLIFAGALKDAGAAEVSLVAPYLAFARKDRRTKLRDPITTRYVAQMCEAVGIDEIVTMDVHNQAAFENSFRCRKRNVEAASLFAEHFRALAVSAVHIVVVSPDSGGVGRAREFARRLAESSGSAVDLAFVEKHRSEGRVSGGLFAGEVDDAVAIIIDDMISGGTTMLRAASLCRERGARGVHAAATHGVFTVHAGETLADPGLDSIVVTDTVADVWARGRAFANKLTVLETAGCLARAIR